MEFKRRALQTDDATMISFLDSGGSGSEVVILHGLAGSAAEFIPTAHALPEHRVLLVDQRGHGHSTRRPIDSSRAAFVHDCVAVIEAECSGAVALVGQSMGAHTAMLAAATRPDLVAQLVLLEGNEGGGELDDNEQLGHFFRSWPVPFKTRGTAREFLGDGPLERAWVEDLEERSDGYYPRFDPDVMVGAINAVAVPRLKEWQQVTAPTLVVYGEKGMFTEEARARFTGAGQNVTRIDLKGASHDAHLDSLNDWTQSLRSFINAP